MNNTSSPLPGFLALALLAGVASAAPSTTGDVYVANNQTIQRFTQRGEHAATMIGPVPGDTFYKAVRVTARGDLWAADEKHGRIDIYDRQDKRVLSLDTNPPDPKHPGIYQQGPRALALDGSGRVYVGGIAGNVLIYDAASFDYLGYVDLPAYEYNQYAIEVDCEGRVLYYTSASSAPGYCLGQISRYDMVAKAPLPPLTMCEIGDEPDIYALRMLPDGGGLLAGGNNTVRLYSLQGELLWALDDVAGRCTGLAIDPMRSGRIIAKFDNIRGETYDYALEISPGGLVTGVLNGLGGGEGVAVRGDLAPCAGWLTGAHESGDETTSCPADLNGDGVIDFGDYLEFLNLFEALDPRADLNGDGVIDFGDYLEFLNLFEAGC